MKVTFELKVYGDETKTNLICHIKQEKEYPATAFWTTEETESFLDEEYEIWINTRTDGGWKA